MNAIELLNKTDLEILEIDFVDIEENNLIEYDISKVRGSVRIRSAEFITKEDINSMREEVKNLKFPSLK